MLHARKHGQHSAFVERVATVDFLHRTYCFLVFFFRFKPLGFLLWRTRRFSIVFPSGSVCVCSSTGSAAFPEHNIHIILSSSHPVDLSRMCIFCAPELRRRGKGSPAVQSLKIMFFTPSQHTSRSSVGRHVRDARECRIWTRTNDIYYYIIL